MPEVSIYVALITGGVALAPQLLIWRQNVEQANHARHEQHDTAVRAACSALYDSATDLWTQVRSNRDYHGDEMGARVAKSWGFAGDTRKHANAISLLASQALADSARELAVAADRLAHAAAANTKLDLGVMVSLPDGTELESAREDFSVQAAHYFRG